MNGREREEKREREREREEKRERERERERGKEGERERAQPRKSHTGSVWVRQQSLKTPGNKAKSEWRSHADS